MHAEIEAAYELKDRVAVITGAASGLGRQAAITLGQAGARLILADVNESGLAETASQVAANGGQPISRLTNVAEPEQVNALAEAALGAYGRIDIWANVAGVILQTSVADATPAQLERVMSVNLNGMFWGCAAAARAMTAQGSGSIINISSTGADLPVPGLSIYAMTKASVNTLTRTLAAEVGPYGVRVNAIAPGFIDTPMVSYRFQSADGAIDEAKRAEIFAQRAQSSVLKSTGIPKDIALAMLYLAADASRFVTGQVIRVNGGVSMPG